MAAVGRKLLQKLPDQRILTFFNHRNPLTFVPAILQQPKFDNYNHPVNPGSFCSMEAESFCRNPFRFYPSFSFEYFLNQISSSGFCQSQSLEQSFEPDGSRIMWADSVKKKRKRKMNKHKLRKLRKRLRGHS